MKIRLSYSLLRLFEQGRFEDLINSYFKLKDIETTYQMEEGSAWDKIAMESAIKDKRLPKEFNSIELLDPKPQLKLTMDWKDGFELVGVIDIFDHNRLFELKTGTSKDSADYTNEKQVPLYLLLCEANNMPVEKGIIVHYNQSTRKTDMSLVWNKPEILEEVTQWVDSLAPKVRELFEGQGLL